MTPAKSMRNLCGSWRRYAEAPSQLVENACGGLFAEPLRKLRNLARKPLILLRRLRGTSGWLAGAEPLPKGRGFRHASANWAREAAL